MDMLISPIVIISNVYVYQNIILYSMNTYNFYLQKYLGENVIAKLKKKNQYFGRLTKGNPLESMIKTPRERK